MRLPGKRLAGVQARIYATRDRAQRTLVGQIWERMLEIEFVDRSVALAGKAFVSFFPLVIVVAAFMPSGIRTSIFSTLTHRLGISGSALDTARQAFASAEDVRRATGILGLVLTFFFASSFTTAVQRVYLRAWRRDAVGKVGAYTRGPAWLAALLIYMAVLGAVRGVAGDGIGFGLFIVVALALSSALWWFTSWFLLLGQVRWRVLIPTGLITGVAMSGYALAATIWMPQVVIRNQNQFGFFGVALALVTWFSGAAICIVVGACAGPALAEDPGAEHPDPRSELSPVGRRRTTVASAPDTGTPTPRCVRTRRRKRRRGLTSAVTRGVSPKVRAMSQPVLLAIDDDPGALGDLERELQDRYARHYHVVCLRSPMDALSQLEEFADSGTEVALVLAGQLLQGMTGSQVLDEVRRLHPHAKRALLIAWGDWGQKATGEAIFEGIADGRFDNYLLRPSQSPDELFHQTISSMLLEWAEATRASPYTVHIVGESWSGRAYELREALQQCAMVHTFCLADSTEGQALVAGARDGAELPLIVFPDGNVLENPTNTEIAKATGSPVNPERMDFDVIIVGAGPAGLSAAVYGASEGFSTLVVDKGGIGGQATSSSLIRNYLGFPRGVSGRRLAQSAYNQAWVFGADFSFMQSVTSLAREDDQLVVTLSESGPVRTTALLLAMGASYRRLDVPSLEELVGAGVFYGGPTSEAPALAGRDVFIVGGANSAGQAALHLARYARRVTLVVRAQSLRAGMSEYLVRQVEATDNIETRLHCEVVGGGGDGRLEQLVLRDLASESETTVEAQALFLLIGAKPFTDWLPPEVERDDKGFILTGADVSPHSAWPIDRSPLLLETSMPGVFAAGDVRHGAVKRVASAVGEGSIAIQLLHQLFAAEQRQPHGRSKEHPSTVG